MNLIGNFKAKYTFYGFLFGLIFSILGRLIVSFDDNVSLYQSFFNIYPNLLKVIDIAPLVLGFCGFLIGLKQDQLRFYFIEVNKNQLKIFHSVLNNLPYMVFMKDAKTLCFVHLNYAGEVLLGIKEKDILGKCDFDFFPKEQAEFFTEKDRKVLSENILTEIPQEKIQTPSGERILRTQKIAIVNSSNVPIFLLGISEDITNKIEIEKKLEIEKAKFLQSSKLATIGELTAGLAHEINNPLAIISGSIYELERNENDKEKLNPITDKMKKSVDRISKIIRGLKKFIKKEEKKEYRLKSLSDICEEAIVIISSKIKNKEIKLEFHSSLNSEIYCNEVEIEQVVINLISNAIDAAASMEDKWIKLEILEYQDEVILNIIDSGIGISIEIQNRIYDPFFTTKKAGEGSGLGLSIVKGIIDEHNGQISLINKGKHTCFEVKLKRNFKENNIIKKGA